jgi:sodium/pantothenate symporter
MILGMGSYILLDQLYPNPFGVHTVVLPILLSLFGFVLISIVTQQKEAPINLRMEK